MEMENERTKICRHCPERGAQPLTAFYPKRGGRYGVEAICSTCRKASQWAKREKMESGEVVVPEAKCCENCGGVKAASEFYTNPDKIDGLYERCIVCVRAERRTRIAKARMADAPLDKQCKGCGNVKPSEEFYAHSGTSDGLEPLCRVCKCKARDKRNLLFNSVALQDERAPMTGAGNKSPAPVRVRNFKKRVKHLYGLSLAEYNQMLIDQGYRCAICRCSLSGIRVNIDHDHTTLAVRGLLCGKCNVALGHLEYLRNDPDILQNTLGYLRKAKSYGGQLLTVRKKDP